MSSLKNKRVALVYDRVNKWGGAERVLLALHKLFPEAPLYTSVYDPKRAPWADVFSVRTSFLQHLPFARSHHELLPFLMPMAFESFSFDAYDMVISVTSEAAKGIITKPGTKHICYCLTPTRYLWSGYTDYFRYPAVRAITYPIIKYLRRWDQIAAQRPDTIIAISKEVQQRVKKYYGREAEVIYPPVTELATQKSVFDIERKDKYFLVVSRLSKFTSYKRVDLAIRACSELGLPLKVIGTGNWLGELKDMAGPSVEFLGTLTDEKLAGYYKNCQALIFPGLEDFGLTMVEAQQYGKPVIAFNGGGALEVVLDNQTGILFSPQTVDGLKKALQRFAGRKFSPELARKQARLFSENIFQTKFTDALKQII